jgi:ATP-dependent DNA ligase
LKENIQADACILDGEVLVLEKNSLTMVPFGMNKQVALDKDKTSSSGMQICYKVFDTLWVRHDNEEANLMGFALKKRKNIMEKFIKEEKGRLEIVRGEFVTGS